MAKFINLTQVEPGYGPMIVNLDRIVLVTPSTHADGGTDIVVENGKTSYDAEEGYRSYTVTYRIKQSFQAIKDVLEPVCPGL